MKSQFHINSYIKEKKKEKINGLIRTLINHGDFNRIEFGSALWKSVPPSAMLVTFGFQPWQADTSSLESLQYQAAKAENC